MYMQALDSAHTGSGLSPHRILTLAHTGSSLSPCRLWTPAHIGFYSSLSRLWIHPTQTLTSVHTGSQLQPMQALNSRCHTSVLSRKIQWNCLSRNASSGVSTGQTGACQEAAETTELVRRMHLLSGLQEAGSQGLGKLPDLQ